MSANNYGFEEETTCRRDGCDGVISSRRPDNCSCHISPPCSACTAPRNFCPKCGWEEADEVKVERINDYVVKTDKTTGAHRSWTPRPLDPTKIDWHSKSHTNSSMIKEGVYPEGTTREELIKRIDGTFGGRFEYHYPPECGKPGRFKYIAYTD
jgi:hypothetical protein